MIDERECRRPRKINRREIILPALTLRNSEVAGMGLFAGEDIKRNQWVTEYGGEVVSYETARLRRANGEDTHIRTLGYNLDCLDSRVRGTVFTYDYYVERHMAGGFINDPYGTGKKANCRYVCVDEGYQHPYPGAGVASRRCFIQATRKINVNEELLIDYGRGYAALHFGGAV